MSGWTLASLLIPEEAYVLLIVVAGLMIMIGIRRAGAALIGFVFLSILLTPLIEPLLAELPDWVIWVILGFFAMSLLRFALGREVWANMWGTLLGNLLTGVVLGVLRAPFRLVGAVFRLAFPPRRG